MNDYARPILASRKKLVSGLLPARAKTAEEGGCGVVGFASSVPVSGRHIFAPSVQMHNRGNGKGGGIAAAGLVGAQLGVDAATLRDDYLLQVALLDPQAEGEVERRYISSRLRIDHKERINPVADYRQLGLEVRPPDIVRYFVRAEESALAHFAEENGLADAPPRVVEDEFVYQNSFRLNQQCYAALGEKRAFVLSHARDLMVFKIVGYAEQVVQYYGLEDLQAHIWIAHQRYPTKGRVWHPAGAHPFIGMNEALVHNGDFANYFSICEYLRQHNVVPLFLTDTEASVLLFDLWRRVYRYPLEYVIEALAPTTELDFESLPTEKKEVYRALQAMHVHSSPDGPWFFIIVRSDPDEKELQLLGITDTSMLRPQVFAIQEGEGATIGLIASEKQAIDATLRSLAAEDSRFHTVADRYWNARGGSYTDGGAFAFTVNRDNGYSTISCTDKFGNDPTRVGRSSLTDRRTTPSPRSERRGVHAGSDVEEIAQELESHTPCRSFFQVAGLIPSWNEGQLRRFVKQVQEIGSGGPSFDWALELLTLLNDRRYDCGGMKRSIVLQAARQAIDALLDSVPAINNGGGPGHARRVDWATREHLRAPVGGEMTLVVLARDFPPEGEECDARLVVRAYELGWRRFVIYGMQGQRFTGCGLGPGTDGVRIDIYGSSGDYVASGIDGLEVHVHGNGQDQLGQIIKRGTLVIYGDVGQTFMYGAKGGEVYVMGNAAGRPLINGVGRPRVVINGTCLDFLAESFMAGDPHNGGGFVILNGVGFDDHGRVQDLESPYPGSNLFSLASGGAIFIRDPHRKLVADQLNGGEFAEVDKADWELILPYLQANERRFGISVERDLLTVDGVRRPPGQVYRKVQAVRLDVLTAMHRSVPAPLAET